jgi:hypothetical protein
MREWKWAFYFAAAVMILGAGVSKAHAFSCVRHIYNHSSCKWVVQANGQNGNVYFRSNGSCRQLGGPCVILPGSTVTMQYTYTSGITYGTMTIADGNGAKKRYKYGSGGGVVKNKCPSIYHPDEHRTGGAYLNEPTDGDFTIGQCGW